MDVPYASRGKSVGDLPCAAAICRNVDVDFHALAIVEILAPVNASRWNGGDVKRPCAALHLMSHMKFIVVCGSRYERTRHRAHHRLAAKNGQRMKTIAQQAIT